MQIFSSPKDNRRNLKTSGNIPVENSVESVNNFL